MSSKKAKERGYNASKLSRETGMSVCHMSRVMRGLRNPTVATLRKMAESMGITVDYLDKKLQGIRATREAGWDKGDEK